MLCQMADSIHGSMAGDNPKALPSVALGPTRNRWRMLLTTTPSRTSPTRGSRRLSQSYSRVTRLHTDSCCEGVTAGQQRRPRHGGIGCGGGKVTESRSGSSGEGGSCAQWERPQQPTPVRDQSGRPGADEVLGLGHPVGGGAEL